MNYIQENMERSKGDSSGYVGLKSSKTRFEQMERDKNFPYVENRIFDFVSYFKKDQMDNNKSEINLIVNIIKLKRN